MVMAEFWFSGSPLTAEVQQCQNCACDLDLEMRSKLRGHEISIGTAAFRLAPSTDELLVTSIKRNA